MSRFIDGVEQKFDNYEVLPHYEWVVLGMARAKKRIRIPRWCVPACPFFKEDWDHTPLCFDSCKFYTFDRHIIEAGEGMLNIMFAVNPDVPNEAFSTWVSETYLRSFLGERYVNKMIEQYQKTFVDSSSYTINAENDAQNVEDL